MIPTMSDQHIPDVAYAIRDDLVRVFGSRLQAVLLYGSALLHNAYWDLDLVALLAATTDRVRDLAELKRIHAAYAAQTLDLQLFYPDEIDSPDLFSLDAHGAFFWSVLARAHVLYGVNPCAGGVPHEERVVASLVQRIQRYVFQARQEYLDGARHTKDRNPDYHTKHVRRCMYDLLLMVDPVADRAGFEEAFHARFPETLTERDRTVLRAGGGTLEDLAGLYEAIYETAVRTAKTMVPSAQRRAKRAAHNGIVFEYLLPEDQPIRKAVVLLDGLPRTPALTSMMSLLADWGCAVFFPRLRGTWESSGEFLTHDPALDVIEVARALYDGLVLDGERFACEEIVLWGSSFGATVALAASAAEHVRSVIACSPFIALREVEGVRTLWPHLCERYAGAYRSSEANWHALLDGAYLSLETLLAANKLAPEKCTVLCGAHDTQVASAALQDFCARAGIASRVLPGGHLTLHKDIRTVRPLVRTLLCGDST